MSNYSMAVGAPNNALSYFSFCLLNAFCKADVKCFVVANMIKIQGSRIIKPAINATDRSLVVAQPLANECCTLIRLIVDTLSIARLGKTFLSPFLSFGWVILANARFAVGGFDLRRVAVFPSTGCGAASGFLLFCVCWHVWIVRHLSHPCKPDIFAKTYEAVE